MDKTGRGFDILRFVDSNGQDGSLQKSSIATEQLIWLGCNEPSGRMHLNQEQVKELLPFLVKFAEIGELSEE